MGFDGTIHGLALGVKGSQLLEGYRVVEGHVELHHGWDVEGVCFIG